MSNSCGAWYEGDTLLENYHENEWCKVSHDDRFQFEMLCLEGASTGLSWKTIMHRRNAYKAAFNNFSIEKCASMTDEALEKLMNDSHLTATDPRFSAYARTPEWLRSCRWNSGPLMHICGALLMGK